jgi:hypothetical protein
MGQSFIITLYKFHFLINSYATNRVFYLFRKIIIKGERDGTEARFIYYHFDKTRRSLTVPGESSFIDRAKTPTSDRFKILKKFRNIGVSL